MRVGVGLAEGDNDNRVEKTAARYTVRKNQRGRRRKVETQIRT